MNHFDVSIIGQPGIDAYVASAIVDD